MKKVIFGAAALVFSCALFAQAPQGTLTNVLDGTFSMDANVVSHLGTTTNPSGGNTGESIQNGNTNKVKVRQAGTNQSAFTDQADGSLGGDNKARIWQTGDVGPTPNESGYGNASDIRQRGYNNQASAYQEGDENEAVLRQGMKDDASKNNKAFVNHGIGENGEQNYAMTEQDGENNTSTTVQVYDNNQARTVQGGIGNMADIRQNGGADGSAGHIAMLIQEGDNNASRIRQFGSNTNGANSTQLGNDNKINQIQTSNGPGGGNTAITNQGANPLWVTGGTIAVRTTTRGVDDVTGGGFNGNSDKAKALQIQNGDSNQSLINQYGSGSTDGNIAEQRQVGDRNIAFSAQNVFGVSTGGDNYLRQDQTGDDNKAGAIQLGNDHLAYQRQEGDRNEAYSTQRGTNNHLSTFQGGNDNILETAQRGSNNTTLIVQKEQGYGGHSYKVSQNVSDPNWSNGSNIVDVLQLGPNGDFGTDAEGCDFQDPTDLQMPNGVDDFDIANPCGPGGC